MKPPDSQDGTSLEVTWQNRHPNFSQQWPCFSAYTESGIITAEAADYYVFKDSFISSIGLWHRNKTVALCLRRDSVQYPSFDYGWDMLVPHTRKQTEKCYTSYLSQGRYENCGVNSLLRANKLTLFPTLYNKNDQENERKEHVKNSNKDIIKERNEHVENNNQDVVKVGLKGRVGPGKSFYSLDLTSPLGQLVINHLKGDPSLHVLSDIESHCLTSLPEKEADTIQLRARHVMYPITFKDCWGKLSSHVHEYRFSYRQKSEFMRRVNSGLDKRSRRLFRTMKPCKVRLPYLTRNDFKRWMLSKVVVRLKLLSEDDISYWTSPKTSTSIKGLSVFSSKDVLSLANREATALSPNTHHKTPSYTEQQKIMDAQVLAIYAQVLVSVSADGQLVDIDATDARNDQENLLSGVNIIENGPFHSSSLQLKKHTVPILNHKNILSPSDIFSDSLKQINIFRESAITITDSTLNSIRTCHKPAAIPSR